MMAVERVNEPVVLGRLAGFEYKLKIFSSREEWRTIIETAMLLLMKMDGCFEKRN
jgi:hypothetical protein